jgi:hypothetical protein
VGADKEVRMAIGFPAYHEESVRYPDVPRAKLRTLAEDAIDDIGWTWRRESRWRLVANVPMTLFVTWGERVIVEVDEEELFVRSEGLFALAWLDLGRHQANVHKLISRVEDFLEE